MNSQYSKLKNAYGNTTNIIAEKFTMNDDILTKESSELIKK